MSFDDSSSLDLSLMDFDLDDEPEIHPLNIKKKRKHKKRRIKKKKRRRRIKLTLPSERFLISDSDIMVRAPPPAPTPAPSTAPTPSPAPASISVPTPFPGAALITDQDSDEEIQEAQTIQELLFGDEEEDVLFKVKDYEPEPIGILKILMKRRRDKEEEERRIPSPPPPPPPEEEESIVSEEEESIPPVREVVKPTHPKYISCKFNKPGPGQYDHYSTVGYIGHDPTRKKAPGYSFGRKITIREKRCGPGPKYNMRGFTMRGKDKPMSHQFGNKRPPLQKEPTPGPADYKDQSLYLSKRSQRAILYGRREEIKGFQTPGAIGELTYMGSSKPAACLLGKPKAPKARKFPSPLSYSPVKLEVYKTKSPSFTMGYNRKPPKKDADFFPTVGTYSPNYDYFKKKGNILIPSSNGSCVRIPMDLPEKKKKL